MKEERERWIRRFTGHFGEPLDLGYFRSGQITFRELYERSMKHAENVISECQYIRACAFED